MGIMAVIGVHIGQGQNPTALAEVYFSGWSYTVIRLARLPLETPYPDVGNNLAERLRTLTEDYDLDIRINATGVGSPVINCLRREIEKQLNLGKFGLVEVYLTGGYKAEKREDELMLPKELMISHLKVLFQTKRISGSFEKPEPHMTSHEKKRFGLFKALEREILDYETRVQVNEIHWNPETVIGEHDDLAIALSLACWPLQ